MKFLSGKITDYIVKSGAISEESYAIYQYGFQIGLEMLSCFLVSLFIALYLHMIPQFIVFTGVFIFLRTFAGGMHMNHYLGCFICSIVVQTTVILTNEYFTLKYIIAWSIILVGSILIYKVAPVENINRELDPKEKEHCKNVTGKILTCIVLVSAVYTFLNKNSIVSLIALTILVVFLSQYIGIIMLKSEKNRRR